MNLSPLPGLPPGGGRKLLGITLLESMLALAIATSIVLLGLQNYSNYKRDRDAFALKYNVDQLFQAMRNYYYANCASPTSVSTTTPTLAPSSSPPNPFPISLNTDLAGYLDSTWRPANPLINSSYGNSGYAVQFNNKTISGKSENFCYYFPDTGQTSPNCAQLANPTAIIYLWIAQVVVQVKDPSMTLAIKGLTGADCALTSYTASSIADCSTGVTAGSPAYLVWQRLPSLASPAMSSSLWAAMPAVKQFNLQYTNDSLAELISANYAGTQYYLCGG